MEVLDLKKLQKLMVIQGVSQRELARIAGYKSHAYMGLILRGKVKTLNTDPALRIAHYFGVGVDDLFMTKASTESKLDGRKNVSRGTGRGSKAA